MAVLAQAGLAEHADAFFDIGYDDVNYLTEVAEEGGLGAALSDLGLSASQLAALHAALRDPGRVGAEGEALQLKVS